jgi:hypothetical protein
MLPRGVGRVKTVDCQRRSHGSHAAIAQSSLRRKKIPVLLEDKDRRREKSHVASELHVELMTRSDRGNEQDLVSKTSRRQPPHKRPGE